MHTCAKWVLTVVWAASLAAFPQTGTHVTLNVVAFDSHDQIVGDLTSQDFQVSDQGKPQRIVSFHRNGKPQAPPVVILFDGDKENPRYGTQEMIKALEHLGFSDSLYLYLDSSQGDLIPVHGLPSPQEDHSPEKTPWTEHIKSLLEAAHGNASGVRAGKALRVGDGVGTLPAIETLGEALRPFPGRKNVIWITSGVPFSSSPAAVLANPGREPVDNSSLINRMATTLDYEGVTLSSVYQGTSVGNGDLATLDQFAQLTGGKVYHNDIEKAVKDVMAVSGSGYVIEYDAPQPDGKYHKIRVTCSRKGVRLQVKQGYYAN